MRRRGGGAVRRIGALTLILAAGMLMLSVAVAVARPDRPLRAHTARGTTRCRKGRVLLRLPHGRRACLAVRRSANEDLALYRRLGRALRLRVRRAARVRPAAVLRALTGAQALTGLRRAQAAEAALPPADPPFHAAAAARRPRARAAASVPTHTQRPVSTPDGWTGTSTADATTTAPDPGQDGDAAVERDAVVRVHKGSTAASDVQHDKVVIHGCPTAAGDVSGTVASSRTQTVTERAQGAAMTMIQGWAVHGTITARTTDQGVVPTFDLDVVYELFAKVIVRDAHGRTVSDSPPGRWTVHLVRKGLHVGKAGDEVIAGAIPIAGSTGPHGAWTGGIPRKDIAVADDGVLKLALVADDADTRLRWTQQAWQEGACMSATFTATDLALAPHLDLDGHPNGGEVATMRDGQTAHLAVTVVPVGRLRLAPGTFTTAVYRDGLNPDHGTLAPASGAFATAPVPFTYTAPGSGWTKPNEEIFIYVTVVSHQGKALAALSLTPAPTAYELRLTHATAGSAAYHYDRSRTSGSLSITDTGDYAETRDVQVSGALRLTAGADGTYSAAGPVHWDRSTWSTENDETSNEGKQYPALCELDDHEAITAAADGTISVAGFRPGAQPSGTMTVGGLGETWHQDDVAVSGPCGAYTADYARALLLWSVEHAQIAAGVTPQEQRDGHGTLSSITFALDRGWQPGTGDVVATRTLTGLEPSGGPDAGAPANEIPYTDTLQLVQVPG